MRYLLDTNIVADLVRNPHGRITQRIRKVGEGRVYTSIIVAAELRYGSAKKGSARLTAQLDAVLSALEVLPFDAPADTTHGSLELVLNKEENRSARTIYLSLPRRFRSVMFL